MGPGTAGRHYHRGQTHRAFALLGDFQRALNIAEGTQRIRAANRDDVRTKALRFQARRQFIKLCSRVGQRVNHFNLDVEQIQHQAVTVSQVILCLRANRVLQQGYAVKAQLRRHCRRLANVVRLNCPGGDQRIRALAQGIGGEKFQLAQLIPAHRHGRHIVTLNENIAPQIVRKSRQILQRRGCADKFQTGKAR